MANRMEEYDEERKVGQRGAEGGGEIGREGRKERFAELQITRKMRWAKLSY